MMGGAPAGSPFGGPSATASSAAAGLPFAGIPSELRERAEKILDGEPEHETPVIEFDQATYDRRPFTLRRFLSPHRWRLLGALALVVTETIALQAGPALTRIGLDNGVLERNVTVLWQVGAAYLAAIIISAIVSYTRLSFTGRMGERLMFELRVRVFSHLQRLSLEFYTDEKAGRLMTRMTSDIDALSVLFQDGLVNLAAQGLTLIVITVILFLIDPSLALITLLLVVPIMTVLTLWFRSVSDRNYGLVRDRIAEVLSDLQESLSGMRVITANNRRRHNVIHHRNVVGAHRDANVRAARDGAVYGPGGEAVGYLGQALLLAIGGKRVLDGTLTLGDLFAFLLYLTAFFAPIQQLVQLFNSYQQGRAAVVKIGDLLATEPGVPERADAVELPSIDGLIELDDVTFGYDPAVPVLQGLDLRIEAGEVVAIVGPTGAGKSTVAKLVTRFYDPDQGAVRIDGHDLRDLSLVSLRRQLGVVPQEPFLFSGSIRDNVSFARPDASEDEILAACHAVGLDQLIERLPDGLDAPVHERGASLSSGERQLLALARAFLARPRVLVLDEATSNLDLASETLVEGALDVVLEGRTAIVIAHRLATAMRADRIAVVDDGGLVELGSHDELVAAGGRYAEMFETWTSHTS